MTDTEFLECFEDYRSVYCTDSWLDTLKLTGSIPDETAIPDMRRAMDAIEASILVNRTAILALPKIDAVQGAGSVECSAFVDVGGRSVQITAEVTNCGDPEDEDNNWFVTNIGFTSSDNKRKETENDQ
nr:MAG TPA: hypothetical protein [Caudoviricetes sp.]